MYASGTFPEHINSVYYVKRIYDYEKDAVIAKTRLIGPDFVNFNLTSRSSSNAIIPYTPNTVYWPVYVFVSKSNILRYHVVPNVNINISIGFDYGTNAVRNGTLFRAISQKSIAASGKLAQSRGGFGSVVLKANFNASNPSDCIGLSGGTVRFDTLLQSGMAQYSSNLLIKLTDLNVTTGTLDDKFLWSTGIINGTTMTRAQHDAAMSNSMFTTGGTVTFGDRLFAVTYAPNDAFMAQYSTFDKWIALIIFLCAIVISWGACTVLFFVNRLSYSRKLRAHSKRQYQTLKDNQDNLTALLRRIANQEQKTRATINALPDYVIVTNAMGKIVQFNTAFEELFQHTEQQLAEGIFISSVFFKLYNNNPNWFKLATDDQTIESTMETKKGEVNVKILVRPLNSVSALHDNDLTTKLGHNDIADDSEDYVIIARPV
jgi:PAS domain-containing protein